jgi:hypothetical protein
MKQVPDRKRLRREYLTKRADVYAKMIGSAAMALVGIAIIASCGFINIAPIKGYISSWILFLIGLLLLAMVILNAAAKRHTEIRRELDAIPYVPPVSPDTLPTDEILVRGSEEPPVMQSEVLLRAATGQETPKEELLRVSQE